MPVTTRISTRIWSWFGTNSAQVQTFILFITAVIVAISAIVAAKQLKFTAKQIKNATSQTQATTIQEISKTSRELFLHSLSDPDLKIILDPTAENNNPDKANNFVGMLIQHFATIFDLWQLGTIPDSYWTLVKTDCSYFFQLPEVKKKWTQVKSMYQIPKSEKYTFYDFGEQLMN